MEKELFSKTIVAAIAVMGYQTGKIVCVVNGYNIISLTYNV